MPEPQFCTNFNFNLQKMKNLEFRPHGINFVFRNIALFIYWSIIIEIRN